MTSSPNLFDHTLCVWKLYGGTLLIKTGTMDRPYYVPLKLVNPPRNHILITVSDWKFASPRIRKGTPYNQ